MVRCVVALAVLILGGCAGLPLEGRSQGVAIVDSAGRAVESVQTGSSLITSARALQPNTLYEFRASIGEAPAASAAEAVSFARLTTNARGDIAPFVLWYNSGVVGCSERVKAGTRLPAHRYQSFEEAEAALDGATLTVSVHPVDPDPTGRAAPMTLRAGAAAGTQKTRLAKRRAPIIYPSDASGCLLNSAENGTQDMFVSGRNFKPGEAVLVSVVPNQRGWHVGDAVEDVTGSGAGPSSELAYADHRGRFTVRVWDQVLQRHGAYDLIAQRDFPEAALDRHIRARDIVSFGSDTGYVLYLRYPIGGPTMDLAGRPIIGSPYFQFADSFALTNDTVWGAVDPTYVPVAHPGGTYAAYYVVNHRDVAGWDPTMGGSISLTDVSGGIEIMPVKAGCVNGTDVPIWNPPLALGNYDVVVDFGQTPAETQVAYTTDNQYNEALDFLDGADQIGFTVAPDPYELGTFLIGQSTYSTDDFFPTLGGASNVDLRAVVRYPATVAGVDQPVAAGSHPIFIIEHGNHSLCNITTDGVDWYVTLAKYLSGQITGAQFQALQYTHANCPDRKRNHEGYMHLLDDLASHGIIAVSIDAYDLTGPVPGWITERSQLILKHLELWSHMNNTATFAAYPDFFSGRFAGHVDLNSVSVCGHSRGGEASVGAYMLNNTFGIKSVSSIAPVDFQSYTLPEVPYFVILPAADGDVSDLSGQQIYDRAGTTLPTPEATTKSTVYVYGANHNFFNTVWAADIDDCTTPRDDYIIPGNQQKIGEAYLAAFVRSTLLNETVYEDMLRGQLIFPSTAGYKIYYERHEKNHSKLEAGGNVGTPATMTAAVINNPSVHQTQAVKLNWASGAATLTYVVPGTQQDTTGKEVLSFRVAKTLSGTNPAGNQDFMIELVGGGKTKATYASRFDPIPTAYNHPEFSTDNVVMTTVRIPLHSFIMNKSGVTLNAVDTIRFTFNSPTQGEVYVDDIEFSR